MTLQVSSLDIEGYEAVYQFHGEPSGYLALHRTVDGRAFGGLRIRAYAQPELALSDALRLSRAMTLKLASVEIPGGGGKAVIEANSLGSDRAGALARFGDWVESLGGRYVTGPDYGVNPADLAVLTAHTTSIAQGDLSIGAALGVRQAMRGARIVATGRPSLAKLTIAIQGLGAIGGQLARRLHDDGARLIGADVDPARVAAVDPGLELQIAQPEAILSTPSDILAPCAVGAVITAERVPTLATGIVCGGANNILDDDRTADALHARGILFVPDFLANAGGAIQGAWSHILGPGDYTPRIVQLEQRVTNLLTDAQARGIAPLRLALERFVRS